MNIALPVRAELTICNRKYRGEQTATALEANLTSLESKLDEILAAFGVTMEEEEGDAGAGQEANNNIKKDESGSANDGGQSGRS